MIKRIKNAVLSVLVSVLLILTLANVYVFIQREAKGIRQPSVMGISWAVVMSGSMEPAVSVDDIAFFKRQREYREGDIIAFDTGSSVVTHRIYSHDEDGFITKGDANNAPDSEKVAEDKIIGKLVFTIPSVGKLISFCKTPLGMMILFGLGFLIFVLPAFKK